MLENIQYFTKHIIYSITPLISYLKTAKKREFILKNAQIIGFCYEIENLYLCDNQEWLFLAKESVAIIISSVTTSGTNSQERNVTRKQAMTTSGQGITRHLLAVGCRQIRWWISVQTSDRMLIATGIHWSTWIRMERIAN